MIKKKYNRDWDKAAKKATEQFLAEAGAIVEGAAKANAPVLSHTLKQSINSRVEGDQAIVGTNVHYAPYQEYGTYKMPKGNPFLRPAIDQNRNNLTKLYAELIGDNFSG